MASLSLDSDCEAAAQKHTLATGKFGAQWRWTHCCSVAHSVVILGGRSQVGHVSCVEVAGVKPPAV